MSTPRIIGMIKNTVTRARKISKKNIKVGLLTAALVTMPALVEANNNEAKSIDPLSSEQSAQLKAKLTAFSPIAKEEPKKIAMEVVRPEPKPEPAPPAPAPEAPRPAVRQAAPRVATRNTTTARSSSAAASGASWEQCIPFARRVSGVQVRGYAGDVRPNSSEASVGSVALFAGYGHAAVVTGVNGDSVTIKEANYVPGKITERTVPKSQLRGYVRKIPEAGGQRTDERD